MSRIALLLVLVSIVLLPTHAIFAQGKTICAGKTCTEKEVGPFMKDISGGCGNRGDCTIADISQVFANVGNWILGLIGALVFLMYIYGGILWLTSQGSPEKIGKGKKTIQTATVGLVIVFVAFAAITTLEQTLRGKSSGSTSTPSLCEQKSSSDLAFAGFSCQDKTTLDASDAALCVPNLCPGGTNIQCCP